MIIHGKHSHIHTYILTYSNCKLKSFRLEIDYEKVLMALEQLWFLYAF